MAINFVFPFLIPLEENILNATRLLSGQQNNNLYFETFHYCTLVFEDAPISSNIIKVSAQHTEGKSVLYNIVGGNQDGLFSVNQITGQVSVAASLDHEVKAEHSLIISAESFDGATSETTLDILVADVNDNAPVFEANQLKVSVVEEDRAGLPKNLGKVYATDPDWLDQNNLLYTLIGDGVDGYATEDALFTIIPQTGQIFQVKPLDRDPPSGKPIWKLKVKVHDGQSNWVTSRIISGKKPVNITASNLMKNNARLYQKPSLAPDTTAESHRSRRSILSTSIRPLKYASMSNPQTFLHKNEHGTSSCELLKSISAPLTGLQATRLKQLISEIIGSQNYEPTSKVNVVETEVIVEVEDINDNPPIFPNTTINAEVQENGPMDLHVAMVTAWDADDPTSLESRLHYYLEQNAVDERNGNPIFRIKSATGEIRTNVCCLDRESTFEYLLQVVATDGGGLKGTGTVAVRLSDVNDNSPRFARPEWQVIIDETSNAEKIENSTLFEITVSDPDTMNHFLFRVVESSGWGWQFFGIRTSGSKGEVYAKQPLDFEDERQREGFRFLVEVTDQGNWNEVRNRESTWIVVKLRDVNDNPPVFQQTLLHVTVREDIRPYTLIAKVAAVDPDQNGNGHVDYMLIDQWGNLIINEIGEIRTRSLIDREGSWGSRGIVRILAVDSGIPPRSSTATLDIEVTDVNDCPPRLIGSPVFHVPENIQPSRVGILLATDDDLWGLGHGPPFIFELDPSNTPFVFENFNLKFMQEIDSGRGGAVLSTRKTLDREEMRMVVLNVSINDAGNLVSYHDVTVIVDDVNDNDMKPSSKVAYLWKAQHTGVESSIGRVYVDDPDDWDFADKNYEWAEPPHPLFTLNQSTGDIRVSPHIREGRYNLRFKVSDLHRGQQDVAANVTVDVRITDVASFSHAVALTLSPITSYALTQNWIPFTDEGKLGKLTKLIRLASSPDVKEVEVVSIDDLQGVMGNEVENSLSTSIWIAAKNKQGHYLDSSKFRGLIELHRSKVESLINLKMNFMEMTSVDFRGTSTFSETNLTNSTYSPFALSSSSDVSYQPLHSSSSSPLLYYSHRHQNLSSEFVTLQDVPLQVVDSNRTSLITPQISRQFFCRPGVFSPEYPRKDWIDERISNFPKYLQCNPSTCFNGGKCVPSENGSRCICPGSTWGRHCKHVTRSFSGKGFAWFDSLPPCYPLKMSLNILVKGQPEGILIYAGPLSNGTSGTYQRNSQSTSDKPTALLVLQIKDEKFQLIVEGILGSSILELGTKDFLTERLWITIHIYVDAEEAYLMSDGCSKNWGQSRNNSSHCLSHVRWKGKSSTGKYPWKVPWQISLPLQVGGLAHEVPEGESHGWSHEISRKSFKGCLSKLRINDQIIDLGEPALSHDTEIGCPFQQFSNCYTESCLPQQHCNSIANNTKDEKCFCRNVELDSVQTCHQHSPEISLHNEWKVNLHVASSMNPRIATFQINIKTKRKSISILQFIAEARKYFLHLHVKNGIACLDYYNNPSEKKENFPFAAFPTTRNLTVPSTYQKEIPKNKIQWKIKELNHQLRENTKPQILQTSEEENRFVNRSVCLTYHFLADGAWHLLRGRLYGLNLELELDDGDAAGERNETLGFMEEKLAKGKLVPEPFQLKEGENCVIGGPNYQGKVSVGQHHESDSSLCLEDFSFNGEPVDLSKLTAVSQQDNNLSGDKNIKEGCPVTESCEPLRKCDGMTLVCNDNISSCSCQMGSTPTSSGCKKFSMCDYDPCLHGGTCAPSLNTGSDQLTDRCFCPPSFVGYYCEYEIKKEAQEKAFFAGILALIIASCIVMLAVVGSLIWKHVSCKRSQRANVVIDYGTNAVDNQLKAFGDAENRPEISEFPRIVEATASLRQKSCKVPQLTSQKLEKIPKVNILSLYIDDSLSRINNEDTTGSVQEDLRSYAYEGDGSSSGSLGSALSDLREELHDSIEILPLNPITKDVVDLLKDLPDDLSSTLKKKKVKVKYQNEVFSKTKVDPSERKLSLKAKSRDSISKTPVKSDILLTNLSGHLVIHM